MRRPDLPPAQAPSRDIGTHRDPASPGRISCHATALVIGEGAVLLRGPAGAGKTSLALALIAQARQEGRFARLIADDRVHLRTRHGRVIVTGPGRMHGCAEMRGAGIAAGLPWLDAALLRLVVDLDPQAPRHPPEAAGHIDCEGAKLRYLRLRIEDALAPIAFIAAQGFSENALLA
jgi:HPr kinase/phosphorylase